MGPLVDLDQRHCSDEDLDQRHCSDEDLDQRHCSDEDLDQRHCSDAANMHSWTRTWTRDTVAMQPTCTCCWLRLAKRMSHALQVMPGPC